MKRSALAVGATVLLAVAGCGGNNDSGGGGASEPSPPAPAGFRLTSDELWDRYPVGAAWKAGAIQPDTVATIRVASGEIPACGKQKVPVPAGAGGHLESGMTESYVNAASFGVAFPDAAAAESFFAQLKSAATGCESVTTASRSAGTGGTESQRAERSKWVGLDIEFPYKGGRGALAFRQRGNVVVAVFITTTETKSFAAQLTSDTLDTNVGMLLDQLDGTATPRKVPAGQVDLDALCQLVGRETLATLAGGRIDQRAVSKKTGCTHTGANGAKVLIMRVATGATKDAVSTMEGGVVVAKGGTVISLTVTPKATLTSEQWTKVGEEVSAHL